jgi:ribosome maturation protein Sdo1
MSALQRVQSLCDSISTQISNEAVNAEKVNKAAHARIRAAMNELKKIITPAKQESIDICSKK